MPSHFKLRIPKRRTVFQTISVVVVLFLIAFGVLGFWVYRQSVRRFEVRRLSLPTRIYADYMPLRPDTALQQDDLLEKLSRLGYREAQGAVAQPGEYAQAKGGVEIYTREFTHPSGHYAPEAVKVTFKGNAIASVTSLKDNAPRETIALEPELLTSILSEQLENRMPVTLNQVPQSLQDAVVVTEDIRFWHHPGVDPLGIARALFTNVRGKGAMQGGSTLTQQLVKNYYLTSERTLRRKVVEAFMAVILDAKYSKKEILEAYLNDIYLGRNRSISIMGMGEASRFYFGKPLSEINVAEAALLAGMIRSPNNYSPFNNPDRAMSRRATVLGLMLANKKIDRAAYDQAMATPLPRRPFRERSGLSSIPFYVDRVLQEMARDYGIKDVKGRGLQIYTAIDLVAQDTATRSLVSGIEGLEKGSRRLRRANGPLQGVLIHVDVPTGEIRALVGGRNYEVSQFNRALNAKRQVGSLFKPFVYLTAFEPSLTNLSSAVTPATLVSDSRFVLKRRFAADWSPRNYEDAYHGTVTVQRALEQSMNSASVRIGLACGIDPIIKTAHTLGVESELDNSNPSIILGAVGISPIEMADAYSTLAREGSRLPLRTVRFVTDDRGRVVSAGGAIQPVQVFPARDVFVLLNVMKGVMIKGTAGGSRSMGFRLTAAGKTGTTNDERDAWFIGFTPQTLALTWIGFDDNSMVGLSGGTGAVPIWTRYMMQVTAGQKNVDWPAPAGIEIVAFDETSGGLATPECPSNVIVTDAFKSGTSPTQPCPLHTPQAPPPPAVDQFGNPIALDTTGMMPAPPPMETAPPAETAPPMEPPPQQPPPPAPATDTSSTAQTSTNP